jgi:PAS domain S-box-containing protein
MAMLMPASSRDGHGKGLLRFRQGGERPKVGGFASMTGRHKDGSCFPIELSLSEWRDVDGHFLTAIIRDTSERDRAEAARREGEERFRSVVSALVEGIVLQTADGAITACNASAERILGLTQDQMMGRTSVDPRWRAVHEDGSPFPGEEHPSMVSLATGEPQTGGIMGVYKPDGALTWILINAEPLRRPEEARPYAVVTSFSDITVAHEAAALTRQSDEKHRAILATAMDGFWLVDLDGRLRDVNETYARMSGYSRQELLTMEVSQLELLETAEAAAAHIAKVVAAGDDRFESQHRRKDGSVFDVEVSVQASPIDGGRVVVFLRDVTGRKAADALLRSVMEAVDAAGDAVGISDAHGRHFYQNRAFSDLFEYPTAEDLDQAGGGRAVVKDPSVAKEMYDAILNGRPWTGELEMVTKNGRVFTAFERANAIKDQSGAVAGLVGIISDISERQAAEERLRGSEAALKDAHRVARIGTWIWHPQTDELEWSPEMYKIFGIQQATFSGVLSDVVAGAIHPGDRLAVEESNRVVIEAGRPAPLQYRVVWPDGSVHVVWAEAGDMIRDHAGNPMRLTGIVQDITERVRAAEATTALEAQLQQAQKMESVGRLAGGVAHDFNNMLSAILGNTELALEALDAADPVSANLIEIAEAARRSADLTRQLLAFARRQTVVPEALDLNEAVGRTLDMLRRLIGESIDLVWKAGPGPMPIHMDPSQVDQILTNLVVNARDAISDVGRITLQTAGGTLSPEDCEALPGAQPGEYVILTVSDNGCGMDADTIHHVFEPFFTTKEAGRGTGLGLATVHGIVTQNGGCIGVESKVGVGTTLTVHLPRHGGPVARSAPVTALAEGSSRAETILVVEDEPAVLRLAATLLERLGYIVLAAGTPGEAVRLAQEHAARIDLLITDVVMPEMNGRALARTLLSFNPDLRRLFMSGYTADVITHHGVLDPGVHFLQKPFSGSALAAAVRAALEPEPRSPQTPES